jgi:cell division protease FtsH
MTPHKNTFLSKYGRRVLALAAGLLIVTGGFWSATHRAAPSTRSLDGIAEEMRKDPLQWGKTEKDASTLVQDMRDNRLASVGVTANAILVSTRTGEKYFVTDRSATFSSSLLLSQMRDGKAGTFQVVWLPDNGIGVAARSGWLIALGIVSIIPGLLLPVIILAALFYFMRRDVAGARLLRNAPDLTFNDVIGANAAKAALEDVMAYLKDPGTFARMGIRPPCGILMTGSPGVGKTRLAQALAGETGASFIAITGSYFSAKYYGVGIKKAQHLFNLARKNAPCIIWIDEADGIGARTHSDSTASEAESNRVVNQVLAEMDGFTKNAGVIVIAATNHPDGMDEAMRRPGRFDREVRVALPDIRDREALFRFYAKPMKVDERYVDFEQLAHLTTGLSPATIAMISNQAGLVARKAGAKEVKHPDFREAIRIARMGELKGAEHALTGHERIRIARHESGHAIVAAVLEMGVLEEVTIVPRGEALGAAFVSKLTDKQLYTEQDLAHEMMLLLGGRNAELLAFGEASTGAVQDLQAASVIAFDAVSKHGFNKEGHLFSLAALAQTHHDSLLTDAVGKANALLDECNSRTRTLLTEHAAALDQLERELLASETVTGDRVRELIAENRRVVRDAA